jgi:membrane-bound inhibitor of C-type lysozyme
MKKVACIIAGLLIAVKLFAQDCTHYLYMQKNKTIEMTFYTNKGEAHLKTVSTVSDVKTENGITTATVISQAYDKNGKAMGQNTVSYKCDGKAVMVEMNFNVPQQQSEKSQKMDVKLSGGFAEFPADMKVGDHLKDASTQMQMGTNGNTAATTTVQITNRVVAAQENVTTPAGTWNCFKITYNTTSSTSLNGVNAAQMDTVNNALSKLKAKFGKLMKTPSNSNVSETTIWYAPDVGMIKSQTKNGTAEITAIK